MKKLYAKTTFSMSKKSNKNASTGGKYSEPSLGAGDQLILAYQPSQAASQTDTMTISHKSRTPKVMANEGGDERGVVFRQLGADTDEATYYYSIAELENLNMLDHRHPQFHRQQRQLQQHRLVQLQLPLAGGGGAGVGGGHPHLAASPIYEAPQQQSLQRLPVAVNDSDAPSKATRSAAYYDDADIDDDGDDAYGFGYDHTNGGGGGVESLQHRRLQHTHSMPSIRGAAAAAAGRNTLPRPPLNDDSALQYQARHYTQPQQQQQQQQQHSPQRYNSVKAHFISVNSNGGIYAEQSIIGARASVMVYDDNQKKWVPSGTSSGLSKVQIYHHQQNNTFRVVGRKLQDHEVVINCSILKGLKYNQATATFHQWRDSKYVYGLNFSSQHDAEAFARAMMHALEVLSGRVANNPGQPTNGNGYEEDMGYRTMTSEDAAILRQQQQITGQITPSAQTPTSQTNQNNIPQSPPTPQGHHRTSRNSLSAPPAPQPQQMTMAPHQQPAQQLYAPPGNGPTPNGAVGGGGMQLAQQQSQQQLQQQQSQIPPAPMPGQNCVYPAAQAPPQQQPQQQAAQQHPIYGSQQMVNAGGYQQPTQYQPPNQYVLSSSNPNLNLHQYPSQQQQQQSQQVLGQTPLPPLPPPHQSLNGGSGPIYVASQTQLSQGIPTSASSNSVVYASGAAQAPLPPAMPNGPAAPPNAYGGGGQLNGVASNSQQAVAQLQQENPYGQVPMAPPMMAAGSGGSLAGIPMPPPLNRMSSGSSIQAPAAPPPPPTFGAPMFNGGGGVSATSNAPPPPQPPAPPAPPAMGGPGAPPPPPPPPMGGMGGKNDAQADLMGSLAAQLQQAKLRKNKQSSALPTENSGSSTSSGGSGNYGTIGRSTSGMASMMDEMAKTLARRRAQAERKEPEPEPEVKQRPWEKSNTLPHKLGSSSAASANNGNSNSNNTSNSGGESPRPMRKRFGSASEETILKQVNGDGLSLSISSSEFETFKADIVREMRAEIQKVKQEIIDVIKSEFNRR